MIIGAGSSEKKSTTTITGHVFTKKEGFVPFMNSGLGYKIHEEDGGWVYSNMSVDSLGVYKGEFPKNTQVDINTTNFGYKNFYRVDTSIFTGNYDEIVVDIELIPKKYFYTESKAIKDLEKNLIQLIIYDSSLFNLSEEHRYTEAFGFKYILEKKPQDREFERNIGLYNWRVQAYLSELDSTWWNQISIIEDSLVHLTADNYGKENEIIFHELKTPKYNSLPISMKGAIEKQKSELDRLFKKSKDQVLSYDSKFILKKVDRDKNYRYIFEAEYWISYNYELIIPALIERVSNKKEIGLSNTADLIIWERIQSQDLEFYGHGGIAQDDLFTVAGRANHLLKKATGQNFGNVSMYSTEKHLKKLQNRWAYWISNLEE